MANYESTVYAVVLKEEPVFPFKKKKVLNFPEVSLEI